MGRYYRRITNKTSVGFTLSELIVATSVLSVFIMLALGAIVPAMKVTMDAETSLASQREVVLTFDRLVAEMSVADRASLSTGGDALSFLSPHEYQGSNPVIPDSKLNDVGFKTPDRIWRKTVVLRQKDDQLWRLEFPFDKGNALFQVLPQELASVADAAGRQKKLLAKNVELFEASTAGSNRVLLKIRSVYRNSQKPAACELLLAVQMRGGM